jgi:cytochrome c oxidase subunit I
MYALEIAGRRNGGNGLIGWFFRIRWGDPSVCAQVLAMLAFLLGGISGLVNASYTLNLEVHNTAFIPGHFHLTIGTAVALSYMGIAYWLVPFLERRELWSRRLAIFQAFLYFVGVLIFSRGMIAGGIAGMPRRTALSEASYGLPAWRIPGLMAAAGGTMMFASAALFFFVLLMTIFAGDKSAPRDIPFTETVAAPATAGWETQLDKVRYWVIVAVCLAAAVYGPFFYAHLPPNLVATGLQYP